MATLPVSGLRLLCGDCAGREGGGGVSTFDAIRALTGHDRRVSIERVYIDAMDGDLAGGMFLSEIVFWCDKGGRSDGWFYRTAQEWQERAYLTRYQVNKYTKVCEGWGWLESSVMKANNAPTVHYRVDRAKFEIWILKFLKIQIEKFQNESANFSKSLTGTTTDTTTSSISLSAAEFSDPRIILSDPVQGPKQTVHEQAGLDPRQLSGGLYAPGEGDTPYRVYREVFDYTPGRTVIQAMNETVGNDPAALQRWRAVLKAYALSGKTSAWVKVQLEWFRDGIPAAWDPNQTRKATQNGNANAPRKSGGKPTQTGRGNGLGLSVLDLPEDEQSRIKTLLGNASQPGLAFAAD